MIAMDMPKLNRNETIIYAVVAVIIIIGVSIVVAPYVGRSYAVSVSITPLATFNAVYPYQQIGFRINVFNTGAQRIDNMLVGAYANGGTLRMYNVSLPPDSNAIINVSYAPQLSGNYTFKVIADPGYLLNIQDRRITSASFSARVIPPESPNVYTSIPNNGIISTQSFTLTPGGLGQAGFLSDTYNLTVFNRIAGNSKALLSAFQTVSSGLVGMNGAYAAYANGSQAYVAWMQGIISLSDMDRMIGSFGAGITQNSISGTLYHVADLTNRTSICYGYQNGWTKVVEYIAANAMPNGCASLVSNTFTPTEANVIVGMLKEQKNLTKYQSNFKYTNSTQLGSSVIVDGNSIAVMSLSNNTYGLFASFIQRNIPQLDFNTLNLTCTGIDISHGNTSLCSYAMQRADKQFNVTIILENSTEFRKDYTFTLYSLVNGTFAVGAANNAASLIDYLNATSEAAQWTSVFKNTCTFPGNFTGLNCTVNKYNTSSKGVSLNLTNKMKDGITLRQVGCMIPGFSGNQTVDYSIPAGNTLNLNLTCVGSLPGIATVMTSYSLYLNYTFANGTIGRRTATLSVVNK